MRFSTAGTLLACAATAHAFADTSPFVLFSSSPLPSPLSDAQTEDLQSSSRVLQTVKDFLSTCPTDLYVILQQESLSSNDLARTNSVPYLRRSLLDPSVQTSLVVSEVVGLKDGSAGELVDQILLACENGKLYDLSSPEGNTNAVFESGKEQTSVYTQTLPTLPLEKIEREEKLADNDAQAYNTLLANLPSGKTYTVIYTTTPLTQPIVHEQPLYEAQFYTTEHMDLKRDLRARDDNYTDVYNSLPLFEKYQFFTPGIFMGLFAAFILLPILYVGISAIAGLQVSYGAFDKEMGPAAQKKQQ